MNICPKRAIQSWVVKISLAAWLISAALIAFFSLGDNLLWIFVTLLVFPLYHILNFLSYSRIINIFFTYTSLTSYWRRYLAPGIKTSDLKQGREDRESGT